MIKNIIGIIKSHTINDWEIYYHVLKRKYDIILKKYVYR